MGGRRKPLLLLAGDPLLLHALRPFLLTEGVVSIVVALAPEELAAPPDWLRSLDPRLRLVAGGATRAESVLRTLEALDASVRTVLVHDAARPLLTPEIIQRCVRTVEPGVGGVAGWPAIDTLKEVDEVGWVRATPDRSRIWHAQTPQAFPLDGLLEGYRRAVEAGRSPTDDAAAFEANGGRVRMVEGGAFNLKVTRPEDLVLAAALLGLRSGGSGEG